MRKHLIWVLALATAVGISSIAVAANQQTVKATVAPSKQKKQNYGSASINVVTTTTDPDGTITPTRRAQIFFDDDVKFTTSGVATCKETQLQGTTTAQAKSACGKTQVGAGAATALVGGSAASPVQTVVTAFNGTPKSGKPVILLHARSQALGLTTILVGTLKNASGDFGTQLDVQIDALPFGSAITRFQTKVQRSFKSGGKTKNYVSARCFDNNRTWNVKGIFTYDGDPTKTVKNTQKCTVKN